MDDTNLSGQLSVAYKVAENVDSYVTYATGFKSVGLNLNGLPTDELGRPILSASLPGELVEDYTDPEIMHENFINDVDIVIDGGIGGIIPSTVIDCTGSEPVLVRKGAGEWKE